METSAPCVRIIDDDSSVRAVLGRMVESAGFLTRLYGSAEQFMSEDHASQPGCVLVDLMLPGLSGADLADWIGRQTHPLPIIIVTGFGTVPAAVQCLKLGTFDFLEKPIETELLIATVRRAVALDIDQVLTTHRVVEVKQNYATLTDREKQVLTCLCQGMLSKQIAKHLSRSIRTVEKHRTSVMKKMQADSLAKLLRALMELGL